MSTYSAYPRYKRLIDIVVSIPLLLVVMPFLLLACLLTLADGHRMPFYTQTRLGLNGRLFIIYKLRTIHTAQEVAALHISHSAPHLTRIGRFLRRTSLDELPQLLNVLKGDMSLIGPRPHAVEFAKYYAELDPRYMQRLTVRPGLVGPVQVSPLRYMTETREHIRARTDCDTDYIAHMSLWLDMRIFCQAVLCVLFPRYYYASFKQNAATGETKESQAGPASAATAPNMPPCPVKPLHPII